MIPPADKTHLKEINRSNFAYTAIILIMYSVLMPFSTKYILSELSLITPSALQTGVRLQNRMQHISDYFNNHHRLTTFIEQNYKTVAYDIIESQDGVLGLITFNDTMYSQISVPSAIIPPNHTLIHGSVDSKYSLLIVPRDKRVTIAQQIIEGALVLDTTFTHNDTLHLIGLVAHPIMKKNSSGIATGIISLLNFNLNPDLISACITIDQKTCKFAQNASKLVNQNTVIITIKDKRYLVTLKQNMWNITKITQ